jgi:hypothetical protein
VVEHEQALSADDAIVHTNISSVPIGTREGTFISHRLRHVILEGGEAFLNVILSFLNSLFGPLFKAGSAIESLA